VAVAAAGASFHCAVVSFIVMFVLTHLLVGPAGALVRCGEPRYGDRSLTSHSGPARPGMPWYRGALRRNVREFGDDGG
jgi:hypothetical protein